MQAARVVSSAHLTLILFALLPLLPPASLSAFFAGSVPASLGANKKLVALNMAHNRLDGNLDAFAGAIPPPRKTSPQQDSAAPIPRPASAAGHRKLAAFGPSSQQQQEASTAAVDPAAASLALSKKLLGTREDWSIFQPDQDIQQFFTLDTQALEAMATGEAHVAGRRLMQAVTSMPTVGGATTSTVSRPPVTGGCVGRRGIFW